MNALIAVLSILIVAGLFWLSIKYEHEIEEAKQVILILLMIALCVASASLIVFAVYSGLACLLHECPSWV